ncbi:hypothetical protein DEO72_LG10g212 [Vigna unguiculata]|uniref:Uncharacterized protein n=1 Tax=Vigna unguiculata TaxID=3917 RepID=A0A4D6N5B3_VIGUN|nr:hypothetical protein DEO72_LG10g212 [Vigna unguiculata]
MYISLIIPSYSTKIDHSGNIQHPNHSIVSPSISLRLRGLAQAKQSRSGESPSAQARLETRKTGTTAGSRLSEIPLAWASGSLAQKLSESPGRLFVRSGQGEPLFVSPRRDWVAWARFTDLAAVSPVTAMFSDQITHAKLFSRIKTKD